MPGSYSDPRFYANEALVLLEEAYEESYESAAGSSILKAIDAIKHLKEEIKTSLDQGTYACDPFEFDESNSAV
jgi:hypothetical protein